MLKPTVAPVSTSTTFSRAFRLCLEGRVPSQAACECAEPDIGAGGAPISSRRLVPGGASLKVVQVVRGGESVLITFGFFLGALVAILTEWLVLRARRSPSSEGSDNIVFTNRACASSGGEPWGSESELVSFSPGLGGLGNLHALDVELVPAGEAHDLADAVDVLLQANNTLDLPAHVLLPFAGYTTWVLFVGRGPRCLQCILDS